MTTTAIRTIKPSPLDARKRPCAVCGQMTNLRSLCALCREDLPALLATLTQQQDAIIARMASNTEAFDRAYAAATIDERLRYQRLCEVRKLDNSADFHKRYEATRKLADGLGAIVRAEIDSSRDEAMLGDLESKIAAVETAIAGLKENAIERVIIAGSRTLQDYVVIEMAIQSSGFQIDEVITGRQVSIDRKTGKRYGADYFGEQWAIANHKLVTPFPADWDTHGKAGGPMRNEQMAEYGTTLIAAWDGSSLGTLDMIRRAKAHGLKVFIYKYNRESEN